MQEGLLDVLSSFFGTAGGALLALLLAAIAGGLVYAGVLRGLRRFLRGETGKVPLREMLLRRVRGPLRVLVPLLCVYAALPPVQEALPESLLLILRGGLRVVFVGTVTWGLLALLQAGEDAIGDYYTTDTPNNLKARKIVTQVRILRRIVATVVVVLALALLLMQYEPFREIGTGILASAGIIGLVVGIAAQRTLGNVVAGIQIAFTQPIRVDDVVIVEGEFGWVEEITLTYVVVRVWDKRRIVLPITHFIEQPFQKLDPHLVGPHRYGLSLRGLYGAGGRFARRAALHRGGLRALGRRRGGPAGDRHVGADDHTARHRERQRCPDALGPALRDPGAAGGVRARALPRGPPDAPHAGGDAGRRLSRRRRVGDGRPGVRA